MLNYIKENNIPKYNEYKESYQLTENQFQELEGSIMMWLPTKLKRVNYRATSSYHLKHVFEAYLGFYVSNYDFKIVMQKLGYKSKPWPGDDGKNLYYNISRKELNVIENIAQRRKWQRRYNK